MSSFILKMLRKCLYYEYENTGKPIVFLYHPNECPDALQVLAARRADSFMGYIFADVIRHRLKLRNLGAATLGLLDRGSGESGRMLVSYLTHQFLSNNNKIEK